MIAVHFLQLISFRSNISTLKKDKQKNTEIQLGQAIQPNSTHSRKSLLNRFTQRISAESETEQSSEEQSSVQNDALKGVKFATNTLTAMKEKRDEIKTQDIVKDSKVVARGIHTLKSPTSVENNQPSMPDERKNDKIEICKCPDPEETLQLINKSLDTKLIDIRQAWKEERKSDMQEIQATFGQRFEELHSDLVKKQNEFENRMCKKYEESQEAFNEYKHDNSKNIDISMVDEKLKIFKKELTGQIESELKDSEKRMKEEQKHNSETQLKKIREEILIEQRQMAENLKEDFRKEISLLKKDIEEQRNKTLEENKRSKSEVEKFSHLQEKCIAEKRQELVEDKFEMKMQLEMKQMKDRLKNDFSKEVEALEEEINELRRTFDNRSANYDEGRGSRYGLSDESSDDDVERLITKQQRKLRKRNV